MRHLPAAQDAETFPEDVEGVGFRMLGFSLWALWVEGVWVQDLACKIPAYLVATGFGSCRSLHGVGAAVNMQLATFLADEA